MNTIEHQFRAEQWNSTSGYVSRTEGDIGWGAKRQIALGRKAFWTHDTSQLERSLAELRQMTRSCPMRQHMLTQHAFLLLAALAVARDDFDAAVEFAERVARGIQTEETARATSLLIRFCALRSRKWNHFDRARCTGPLTLIKKRCTMFDILGRCVDAAAETERLRLIVARRTAADALRLATRLQSGMQFAIANAAAIMGKLLYEQGELEDGHNLLHHHLARIVRYGCADAVETTFVILARIAFHRSQWKHASLLLQELVEIGKERSWPRLMASGYAHEIDLQCCMRDLARARHFMDHLQCFARVPMPLLVTSEIARFAHDAQLRIRALAAPTHELILELERYIEQLVEQGDALQRLRIGVMLVEVGSALGKHAQADAEMLACLRIGLKYGMFQSFFCTSAIFQEKLILVYQNAVFTDIEEAGLRAFMASLIGRANESAGVPNHSSLTAQRNAITARERQVLERMSKGHSNKKIAKSLGIAPETVKSHAKGIFFKLGVANRVEAISRANQLRLI